MTGRLYRIAARWAVVFLIAGSRVVLANEDMLLREMNRALEQLDSARAKIAEEKLPLAERLAELEAKLIEERRLYEKTRRKADNRNLELNQLRNDIKAREQEMNYLLSLFGEYLRNFESRLHIAELRRYEADLAEARTMADRDDLSAAERLLAQWVVVNRTLKRVEQLIGGDRFSGEATGEDGRLRRGTFGLVGPLAVFAAEQGDWVGIVEQRLGSLEPSIAPFGDPIQAEQTRALLQSGEGELPFDGSLGNARKIEATKETLLEHIQKGGVVIYPILGLGAFVAIFSVHKWIRLAIVRLPGRREMDAFLAAVRSGRDGEAQDMLARMGRGPAARMLASGWSRRAAPRDVVEEAMFAELLETRFVFNRGLPFIAVGAACAPLLGLLGTVTGIIATFKLITVFGSGDVKMLSAGISEALITTEFGLLVAIPSLLSHAFLSRKARSMVDRLEQMAIGFMDALSERVRNPNSTPPSMVSAAAETQMGGQTTAALSSAEVEVSTV